MNQRGPLPKEHPRYPRTLVANSQLIVQPTLMQIKTRDECEQLWKFALISAGSTIGLIESYSSVKMPELPLDLIIELRDKLSKVIDNATPQTTSD